MFKNKFNKIQILLLLLPYIDALTSIFLEKFNINISIGIIIKGLSMFCLIIYILFFSKSKYKKFSTIYLIFLFIFAALYILLKPDLFFNRLLIIEFINIFKYLFFPIFFIGFLNFIDNKAIHKKDLIKVCIVNAISYSLLILVPCVTNTYFYSYKDIEIGIAGWFSSANEISMVLLILFPFVFKLLEKKNCNVIFILLIVWAMMLLGTKSSIYGCLILSLLMLVYNIIFNKKIDKFISICLLILIPLICFYSSSIFSIKDELVNKMEINESSIVIENKNLESWNEFLEKNNLQDIVFKLVSGRDVFFFNIYNIYETASINSKIFGIGFTNRAIINNPYIEKSIEMDFLEIFLRFGVIGFILFIMPFISLFIKIIKIRKSIELVINIILLLFILIISFFIGHVLLAPSVSIYIIISMMLIYYNENVYIK